ncbi:MAG: hypothetical protein ABW194_01540 [Novosphingobium sp.]
MSFPEAGRLCRFGALLAAAAPAALFPGESAAQSRLSLDAEAEQTVASNPFLIPGDDKATAIVEVLARPAIAWTLGPGTSLDLAGAIGARQYHRRFGNYVIGRADATFRHRANEYFSLMGAVSYARELPVDGFGDSIDAAFDTLSIRNSYVARTMASWNPDAMTSIVGDLSLQRTSHPSSTILPPTTYRNVRIGFSRRASPVTNVGFATHLTLGDSGTGGESTAKGLELTVARRLASDWRADAQVGVERLSMRGGLPGRDMGSTNISGGANFCYEPSRTVLCLSGALRSALSGIGGLQRELSFTGSLNRRLSERGTLTAAADYRRSRLPALDVRVDVLRLGTAYEHRLTDRLSLTGGVDYLRRTRLSGESIGGAFVKLGITVRGLGR